MGHANLADTQRAKHGHQNSMRDSPVLKHRQVSAHSYTDPTTSREFPGRILHETCLFITTSRKETVSKQRSQLQQSTHDRLLESVPVKGVIDRLIRTTDNHVGSSELELEDLTISLGQRPKRFLAHKDQSLVAGRGSCRFSGIAHWHVPGIDISKIAPKKRRGRLRNWYGILFQTHDDDKY